MKTILLKSFPFLALAGSLAAQVAPSPAPAPELLPPPAISVPEEKAPPQIPSLKLDGAPLKDAIEILQVSLEQRKMDPINVVLSVPKERDIRVPSLTLRNVSGPDALMLIATAAGLELKPIVSTVPGQEKIVGWEVRLPPPPTMKSGMGRIWRANSGGAGTIPSAADGGAATPFPTTTPPPLVAPPPVQPNNAGGPLPPPAPSAELSAEGFLGEPAAPTGIPGLSELPVVGQVFTAGTPPPASDPSVATIAVSPAPTNVRETRVYALGTVTAFAGSENVETTLRELLETDGIKHTDVKLSFHDKTNVLVANGTPRAHELIGQLIQALSKDVEVRESQSRQGEIRDLQATIQTRAKMLDQAQVEIQELRKAFNDAEAARIKSDLELRLFKENTPKPPTR